MDVIMPSKFQAVGTINILSSRKFEFAIFLEDCFFMNLSRLNFLVNIKFWGMTTDVY